MDWEYILSSKKQKRGENKTYNDIGSQMNVTCS